MGPFHYRHINPPVFLQYSAQWDEMLSKLELKGQAGLEAAFQVPMPGDSGSNPDAGSISNYFLTQEIFTPTPADCCP